ncbi:hypothetical protein ACFPM7_14365 [Actinokineospora guangxiensis]|uniref:Uncharacterized protein n=1 Tax=Actinokineospora guangxiensis TaxID=1490288 RepID=A0ABW0EQD3_9PSEU
MEFIPLAGFGRTHRFPVAEIAAVEPGGGRPAWLRIRRRDGAEAVFIVARRRTTTILERDVSARDDAVVAIRARLA